MPKNTYKNIIIMWSIKLFLNTEKKICIPQILRQGNGKVGKYIEMQLEQQKLHGFFKLCPLQYYSQSLT